MPVSGDDKDDDDGDYNDGTPDEADCCNEKDGEEEDAEQDWHKNLSEGRLLGGIIIIIIINIIIIRGCSYIT